MKNALGTGRTMTYTAPAGGVVAGTAYLIGGQFIVATVTALAGVQFAGEVEGTFQLAKNAGEGVLVEGMPVWWDATNLRISIDPTVGLPIGSIGTGGALSADVTAPVRLNGTSLAGRILTLRKRLTIAQVNAGATLVPAFAGLKTRLLNAKAISVGGAAGAVTTVDVLGTQAAASVKLVAFAQASLLQSALLSAGGAGAAILADGASFVANDVNTPITANKTGANITVATAIDFDISFQLEA